MSVQPAGEPPFSADEPDAGRAALLTVDYGPSLRQAGYMLDHWGFLANPDLPDRPGPGYLLVALRERATLEHYDPEVVEYWVSRGGRGVRTSLTWTTPMPLELDFSWGPIRLVDRLGVSNEWLTFGGHLSAGWFDDTIVAIFISPAPLLRRGGHSQGWDPGADRLGAFFGRLMIAVDFAAGFERRAAGATPLARYAAFIADLVARFRRSPTLRMGDQGLSHLIDHEVSRLRRDQPEAWAAGLTLLEASGLA